MDSRNTAEAEVGVDIGRLRRVHCPREYEFSLAPREWHRLLPNPPAPPMLLNLTLIRTRPEEDGGSESDEAVQGDGDAAAKDESDTGDAGDEWGGGNTLNEEGSEAEDVSVNNDKIAVGDRRRSSLSVRVPSIGKGFCR